MRRTSLTVLSFLLCVMMVISFGAKGSYAEDSTAGYKYTVRIYAGNHGNFGGAKEWSATYHYGDTVNISLAQIGFTVTDTKYRVIGVRLTGLDDIYASGDENLTFSVEKIVKDMSFVVAYAMTGEVVEYSVRFTDENGTDLTAPVTYHGMVGDAIVINHLYFEGYTPVAASTEFILSSDPAQNNFTINYKKIIAPVVHVSGGGGEDSSYSSSEGQNSATAQSTSQGSDPSASAASQPGNVNSGSGTQNSSQGTAPQNTDTAGTQQGSNTQNQGSSTQNQGGSASATQMGSQSRGGGLSQRAKTVIGITAAAAFIAAVLTVIVLRRRKNVR
ncbi:MAG: hypothetical protein IKD81_05385 [Eubacteriaceae bacterium]|nr:hypothetical protein [Eubacteriaceae bacterium]